MENGKRGHAPADEDVFLMARKYNRLPEEIRRYKEKYPRDYAWMWANESAIYAAREELDRRERGR